MTDTAEAPAKHKASMSAPRRSLHWRPLAKTSTGRSAALAATTLARRWSGLIGAMWTFG